MALLDHPAALVALLAALVLAFLMWSLVRKTPRAVPAGTAAAPAQETDDSLLLKFITDENGEKLGETVAVEGDRVLLKVSDGFVSVPAAKVKHEAGALRLDFGVDWDEAKRLGEEWRSRSHKVITYSEAELPKDES